MTAGAVLRTDGQLAVAVLACAQALVLTNAATRWTATSVATVVPTEPGTPGRAYAYDVQSRERLLPTYSALLDSPGFVLAAAANADIDRSLLDEMEVRASARYPAAVVDLTVSSTNPEAARRLALAVVTSASTWLEIADPLYRLEPDSSPVSLRADAPRLGGALPFAVLSAALGLWSLLGLSRIIRRGRRTEPSLDAISPVPHFGPPVQNTGSWQALELPAVIALVLVMSLLTLHVTQLDAGLSLSGTLGEQTFQASPTTPKEGEGPNPSPPAPTGFQLEYSSYSGAAFETIPIQGTYVGAETGTILHVQRREGGKWVRFPLPAATDENSSFSAYVELGSPGRYRLRVVDLQAKVSSDVVVLKIS